MYICNKNTQRGEKMKKTLFKKLLAVALSVITIASLVCMPVSCIANTPKQYELKSHTLKPWKTEDIDIRLWVRATAADIW